MEKTKEIVVRRFQIVVLVLMLGFSSLAFSKDYNDDFDTLWESLWSQGGSPQEVTRWPAGPVKYRYFGVNLNVHRANVQKALAAAAEFSSVKFEDVSDFPDAEKVAQLHIEIVANNGDVTLDMPCYTVVRSARNWEFQNVALRMRDDAAYRCNFHEMMHVMGVKGHPSGKTVLGYFRPRNDIYLALDQTMLRTWYAPQMRSGMTPFEALAVLTDSYIRESEDDATLKMEARQKYLAKTLDDMRNYALGKGEPPRIVIRSGRMSLALASEGRTRIAWFLGRAYQFGHIVPIDLREAETWYLVGANKGHSPSQILLARLLEMQSTDADAKEKAYYWFAVAAGLRNGLGPAGKERLGADLTVEVREKLDQQVQAFKAQ
jgi:hypothetical protein